MNCDCYQIGGPWIAENPDCPEHGYEGRRREAEVEALRAENARLRLLLKRALPAVQHYRLKELTDDVLKALSGQVKP